MPTVIVSKSREANVEATFAFAKLVPTDAVFAPADTNFGPVFKITFDTGAIVLVIILRDSVFLILSIVNAVSAPPLSVIVIVAAVV